MPALNPYSVMNSFDMSGGGFGGVKPMRRPMMPTGKQPMNPFAFTGQDQYGVFQGGGDMPNMPELGGFTPSDQTNPYAAPNANQMHIMSANNVGVQNPTQSVANNPYANMFPTFNAGDLSFADNYLTVGEGSNERTDRLPGLGTLSNVRNYYPEFDSLRGDTHMFMQQNRQGAYDPNAMELLIKTAGKEGTRVPYTLQNGQWVPDYSAARTQNWDTNPGDQNRALAMIVGGALAAAYLGPMMAGGEAAGGLGGLGAEAGGFTGFLGEGVASGIPAWDAAAGLGGLGGPGAGLGVEELYGANSGWGGDTLSAMNGGELMGPPDFLAGSGVDPYGAGSGWGGDTLPAMGAPNDTGAGLLDRLTGLGNRVGNLGSSVNRLLGGGQGGVGVGGGGGGGGLAGLIAALYGSNAQENYADQLNQFIQEMRTNANPYMTRLQESYTNPEAYMNSPEMQARLGIEANRLTGIDASKGRLSNDIQRTKLLQDYGMAGLNDYRTGLRNTVQNLWNPNQVFQAQAMMGAIDSAKYSDLARLLGQGSQGGFNPGNAVNDIKSIIDAGGDLWDFIKDWF